MQGGPGGKARGSLCHKGKTGLGDSGAWGQLRLHQVSDTTEFEKRGAGGVGNMMQLGSATSVTRLSNLR